MRFIYVYLLAYFLLLIGAGLALWRSGVLARVSPVWILVTAVIVIGLGLLLAVTSIHTTTITRS